MKEFKKISIILSTLSLGLTLSAQPGIISTRPANDSNGKILTTEDELNAYIAAYGEMHIVKCRASLQNFPFDDLVSHSYEIFDWGCGQGLATLTLLDMLKDRNLLARLESIYLIVFA